jgi:PAS domain S-box-containing protein
MKIKGRIYSTTIASILLILILVIGSIVIQLQADTLFTQRELLHKLTNQIAKLELTTIEYLFQENEAADALWYEQFEEISQTVESNQPYFQELLPFLSEIEHEFENVTGIANEINSLEASNETLASEFQTSSMKLLLKLKDSLTWLDEQYISNQNDLTAFYQRSNWVIMGFIIVVISTSVYIARINLSRILRPISQLLEGVNAISAGDFEYQISVDKPGSKISSDDELGKLANAYNQMAQQLKLTLADFSQELAINMAITKNLQESEEILKRAEQIGSIGSWVRDLKSKTPIISDGMYHIVGIDKETFIPTPQNILQLIHPADRRVWADTMGATEFKDDPADIEISIIRPDGEERRIHLIREVDIDEDGIPIQIVGVIQDITEQRKIMSELAEREQLLQTVLDSNPNMIYLIDHEGCLAMVNRALVENYGRPLADVIGKNDMELAEMGVLDPKTAKKFHQDTMEVLKTQQPKFISEEKGFNRNGEATWMQTLLTPFNLPGKPKMVLGVSVDITERVKALEKVQESENLYRDLFNAVSDAIYISDIEGNILSVNQAACDRLGYTAKEFENMTVLDVNSTRDNTGVPEVYTELLQHRTYTFRVHHSTKNGRKIPTEVNASLFSYKGAPAILGISRDMEAWEEAQRLLQQREQLLSQVLDTNPNLVYLFNAEGRLELANQSMADHLGVDLSALINLSIKEMVEQEFIPEDLADRMVESNQVVIENKMQLIITEGYMPDHFGNPHWFHTLLSPFVQEGEPTKVLGVSIDITERKKNEDHIRNMNQVLESMVETRTQALTQANEELQSFAYSISHDLRAPLRAVNGFSQILIDEFDNSLDEKGIRYLNLVRENAVLMGNLINGLLEFSRKGRQSLNTQPVKPDELIKQVLMDMKHEYPKHAAKVIVNELPECNADILLLRQVYQNLISNAYKFTSKTENPIIEIGSKIEGNEIIYFVKDNGVGFDMKHANQLFGVFQRLHRADEFAGTGVGLAIVQRIIRRHGGTIWAESNLNKGATFFFTLFNTSDIKE